MTPTEQFPIGSLVTPRLERCYTNVRSRGRIRRYTKQSCNFIRVCIEENRERPPKKSQQLILGQSAVVLEHGGTDRYPMLKVLIGLDSGHHVGWVLTEDVEIAEISQVTDAEANKPIVS